MSGGGFLVLVPGGRGPAPQKCTERPSTVATDYWKHRLLAIVPLTAEEYALPLDELAAKYPPPKTEEKA